VRELVQRQTYISGWRAFMRRKSPPLPPNIGKAVLALPGATAEEAATLQSALEAASAQPYVRLPGGVHLDKPTTTTQGLPGMGSFYTSATPPHTMEGLLFYIPPPQLDSDQRWRSAHQTCRGLDARGDQVVCTGDDHCCPQTTPLGNPSTNTGLDACCSAPGTRVSDADGTWRTTGRQWTWDEDPWLQPLARHDVKHMEFGADVRGSVWDAE